jgi:hypothetical protein
MPCWNMRYVPSSRWPDLVIDMSAFCLKLWFMDYVAIQCQGVLLVHDLPDAYEKRYAQCAALRGRMVRA